MSTHDGKIIKLNQTCFVVNESVYVSGAKSIKYIIEDTGTVAATVHKTWDLSGGVRAWNYGEAVMNWHDLTLADLPTYRALLDAVEAKMQQLDSEFPPGSKVK